MSDTQENSNNAVEQEKAYLQELSTQPMPTRLKGYIRLSGPGWLQSALTLGGGSLTGSLYLGVLSGFSMLWLQPLAMILGIIMLSSIGYVTLTTGERPFRSIYKHVNPVLAWGWLIGTMLANMVWALPQYSLATGVLQQNLLPGLLGPDGAIGDFASKLIIVGSILVVTTAITWSYGSGHWGVRLYEFMLKIVVGLIVLCFAGVVFRMAMSENGIEWGSFFGGFIPDFSAIFRPADTFVPLLNQLGDQSREFWTNFIVNKQRDVLMTAFATAVGINMTFLLPYSMLTRGWGKEHRNLSIFDLSTGMFIPFVLATSFVVIASANQFYGVPQPGFVDNLDVKPSGKQQGEFDGMITGRLKNTLKTTHGEETKSWTDEQWQSEMEEHRTKISDNEKTLAAMLVTRDAQDLSRSLQPLFEGKLFSDLIFGFGVLAMAMSSISLLMLISGFVVCEVMEVPAVGWPFRLGTMAAATGALGPFFWTGKAAFWMAVPTSVFGLVLLPIAYLTFFLLINQKKLLGDSRLKGIKGVLANIAMFVATSIALAASSWAVWSKAGYYGIAGIALFLGSAIVVGILRKSNPAESSE